MALFIICLEKSAEFTIYTLAILGGGGFWSGPRPSVPPCVRPCFVNHYSNIIRFCYLTTFGELDIEFDFGELDVDMLAAWTLNPQDTLGHSCFLSRFWNGIILMYVCTCIIQYSDHKSQLCCATVSHVKHSCKTSARISVVIVKNSK